MFIDSDLLRCGAEFSRSAGVLAQRGAGRFGSASLPAKMFGDFGAADAFHRNLAQEHDCQAAALKSHQARLDLLAQKAHYAATSFDTQDDAGEAALDLAARRVA